MYTDYTKLWKLLIDKGITKTDLCRATGISTRTLSKLVNNQSVTTDTLLTICQALDCGVEHIMEFTKVPPRGTLFAAYRLHKKEATVCGALRVVEFEYEGKHYKIGCTTERANRHTVIHCRPGGVVWEQIYPIGITPSCTETLISTPLFAEPGKVCILLIDGAPANITGLDEGIYLSAKREYAGESLYVMSVSAFKLFR